MIAPNEALHLLRQLGLNLVVNDGRLNVSPVELIDDDTRWLIRKHRDAIITELEQDDAPRWAWLACFGAHSLEVYMHPDATHAEMVCKYPSAVCITPLYRPAVERS